MQRATQKFISSILCLFQQRRLFAALFVGMMALTFAAQAREGMWLPSLLKARAADMKAQGLQIPVEALYNDEGTGLNNAVVLFGGGCTGEVISSKGLVLTNHHCGYGSAQRLSSPSRDMFAAGYWARNNSEELPCPGLTVTFIRHMENVTERVLRNTTDTTYSFARDTILSKRIRAIEQRFRDRYHMDAAIQPFYRGNQYWVMVSETYKDIRLVGFPPNGIGFFGGDTDNWMWPRHNADFSVFRIYADSSGGPVAYNAANRPYETKQFFPVCTSGYKEGDFTMVYGFPGTTQEYIASSQLAQVQNIQDPIRIDARTKKLAIWSSHMEADRSVFLRYTSKRAGIANGWKKWQGELRGLNINDVPAKKRAYEQSFTEWASLDTTLPYADNLLPQIDALNAYAYDALKGEEYIRETALGIELIQQGAELDRLLKIRRSRMLTPAETEASKAGWAGFYKNYDPATDAEVFTALMPMFVEGAPQYIPLEVRNRLSQYDNDYKRWSARVFRASMVADSSKWNDFIATGADTMRIFTDPAWQLYHAIVQVRERKILPVLNLYNKRIAYLNRLYMKAQMQAFPGKAFYPDANLTLRLAYGHVKGIDPDGEAPYSYQTNIDEVIAKDQPDNDEFRVPQKIKDLYAKKNYGRWGIPVKSATSALPGVPMKSKRTVPLAFIADNHTSGGNSGSPVLNARGELIGTNFDRIWEGTMSDLYFDPALCRNISVDIRYTLFVIEKFGGAGWLLKEMKLVR